LTKDGRSLLESHRDRDHEHSQTFCAGLGRARELEHDLQVYRAYEQAEDRLLDRGAHIERVVLDHELKSEYQEPDGRWEREDIEVVTPHYRGAHGASVARSGFSTYRGISLRISGRSGGNGGRLGGLAEELWR
jgi:hypothetical protein